MNSPYNSLALFPESLNIKVISRYFKTHNKPPSFTCIIPILNEEKSILNTLNSIELQSNPPSEVIVIDGGSTDHSIDIINDFKKKSGLNILLLKSKPGIGIQRNLGIKKAKNELIMNVDAGTVLDKNYAQNMLGPIVETPDLDLVCGVHYPLKNHIWSKLFSPKEHFLNKKEPYGACILYKKSIATKVGLYPEYITYAGEDTFFIYKYRKASKNWVFNKAAYILWEHPPTFYQAIRKKIYYALAKFEIGLWDYFYYEKQNQFLTKILIESSPISLIIKAFQKKRAEIEINKRKIKGIYLIFHHTNIVNYPKLKEDVISKINDNYKVFYIQTKEDSRKYKRTFLDIDHSLLELIEYKNFSIESLIKRYRNFLENTTILANNNQEIELALSKFIQQYNLSIIND